MKILVLTDGLFPFVVGGMQKHSTNLSKYLALKGVDLHLAHSVYSPPIPESSEVSKLLQIPSEKIQGFLFPKKSKLPGHYIKESYAYSCLLYEHYKTQLKDFDFIYAKGFTGWKFIEVRKIDNSIPPVGVKFHGYEMFQHITGLKAKLKNKLLRKPTLWNTLHADYVFSYGGKITDIIQNLGVKDDRIIECPTGIESKWFSDHYKMHSPQPRFYFLGRYERRKGVEEILEALQLLDKEGLKPEFHFIGPIPKNLVQKNTLKQVHFHGSISDENVLQSLIENLDILVAPSYSEGMPNVILEAAAQSKAIICSNVGANSLIVNKHNGWIFDSTTVLNIAQSIKTAMKCTNSQLEEKKQKSYENSLQFSWETVVNLLLQKMNSILTHTA